MNERSKMVRDVQCGSLLPFTNLCRCGALHCPRCNARLNPYLAICDCDPELNALREQRRIEAEQMRRARLMATE